MVYAKYPGGQYLTQYLVRGLPYEKFGQILTQTRVLLSAYPPSVVLVLMFIQIGIVCKSERRIRALKHARPS